MLMNTAEQILVIILATALAIFIVVGIVATVALIKLLKTLQIVADKTNNLVDSAESISMSIRQAVGNLSILRFARTIYDIIYNKTQKRGE